MKQFDALLSRWREIYDQQGPAAKGLLLVISLLSLCCLCFVPTGLFRSRSPSNVLPSLYVMPGGGITLTPTALFNFGRETFTPFPTFPAATASTALPTTTRPPTESPTSTETLPVATATATAMPTATRLPATDTASIAILSVDKSTEYVEIKNISNVTVDLSGWRLVSELGKQSCELSGVLQPNTILRVWSGIGDPGFSCRFPFNIWNNSEPDAAVLYNPQGEEINRYP